MKARHCQLLRRRRVYQPRSLIQPIEKLKTSGFFQLWRASGIVNETQLYVTAIGGLLMAGLMLFAGWFHYHKAAPKLEWFQNVESMLNHHLAGLLGLG